MDNVKLRRLKEHLCRECSAVSVNRLFRLMDCYASAEGFFALSKGQLQAKFSEVSGKDVPLGASFFECFDRAAGWWRSPVDNGEARPAAAKDDPEFSREQLKKVMDFMEMFDKKSIRLSEVQAVLNMIGGGK